MDYQHVIDDLRKVFYSGKTLSKNFREGQLRQLNKFVTDNQDKICDALTEDLKKPKSETLLSEIGMVLGDISLAVENLENWMKPEFPSVPLVNMGDRAQIRRDPLGVVLIIGAWNYPVQLTLVPLVGAIAAGCCVVLKPSEVSPKTATLLELLTQYLDPTCFKVINGGVAETTNLLKLKWDHIFYTGSGVVGKVIMKAAAEHLTSVTLELGGKSPCIVDKDSDLNIVARRVTWGRFMNCGQTCIAPDYVLCTSQSQVQPLVQAIKTTLTEFYGENPEQSPDYGRIVNERHVQRLAKMLASPTGTIEIGGKYNEAQKYFSPTVITGVTDNDLVMKDEIFGPILPIMVVPSIDSAIEYVNNHDKPLALYLFSQNKANQEKVLRQTSSGGVVVNDVLMHATVHTLPFGGVGPSGCGAYHGHLTFDTFSHKKAILVKDQNLESVNNLRYPKYTDDKLKWLTWLLFPSPLSNSKSIFTPTKILLLLALLLAFVYSNK